ncbi:hypothetical protein BXZ70DRAFT_318383 [Cristinia sonorae]|uniref:Uncharacterized protein n=1 Tax=Cristinia sonorae TaxID=1940300 RepID=A0A8K0UKF1_9AGAR|nr:hypothetical protein BXZ70DRAFT_318383 [Cristinia sonorae]
MPIHDISKFLPKRSDISLTNHSLCSCCRGYMNRENTCCGPSQPSRLSQETMSKTVTKLEIMCAHGLLQLHYQDPIALHESFARYIHKRSSHKATLLNGQTNNHHGTPINPAVLTSPGSSDGDDGIPSLSTFQEQIRLSGSRHSYTPLPSNHTVSRLRALSETPPSRPFHPALHGTEPSSNRSPEESSPSESFDLTSLSVQHKPHTPSASSKPVIGTTAPALQQECSPPDAEGSTSTVNEDMDMDSDLDVTSDGMVTLSDDEDELSPTNAWRFVCTRNEWVPAYDAYNHNMEVDTDATGVEENGHGIDDAESCKSYEDSEQAEHDTSDDDELNASQATDDTSISHWTSGSEGGDSSEPPSESDNSYSGGSVGEYDGDEEDEVDIDDIHCARFGSNSGGDINMGETDSESGKTAVDLHLEG